MKVRKILISALLATVLAVTGVTGILPTSGAFITEAEEAAPIYKKVEVTNDEDTLYFLAVTYLVPAKSSKKVTYVADHYEGVSDTKFYHSDIALGTGVMVTKNMQEAVTVQNTRSKVSIFTMYFPLVSGSDTSNAIYMSLTEHYLISIDDSFEVSNATGVTDSDNNNIVTYATIADMLEAGAHDDFSDLSNTSYTSNVELQFTRPDTILGYDTKISLPDSVVMVQDTLDDDLVYVAEAELTTEGTLPEGKCLVVTGDSDLTFVGTRDSSHTATGTFKFEDAYNNVIASWDSDTFGSVTKSLVPYVKVSDVQYGDTYKTTVTLNVAITDE